MTGAALGAVLGIFTALLVTVGTYYAAKANARDQNAAKQAGIDRAVRAATTPLIADNERLSSELATARVRITQLEDWLREIALRGKRDDDQHE